MSLAFLSKPIGGSKKDAEPKGTGSEPSRGSKPGPMRGNTGNVAVGGAPRVDLMPPEIRVKRSQLRMRRKLRLGLVGVFIVVVAACGGAWAWGTLAQTNLVSAQSERQQLVTQQQVYADVTNVKDSIALIQAGQKVGDSTEIDWQVYLTKLQATLPSGVTLSTVAIDVATPLKSYTQATTPLQGDRIATIAFTATSTSLPSIPIWLDGLQTLPGFVDATPGAVTLTDSTYTATVTLHINDNAFANRFDKVAKKAADANQAAGTTTGGN